MKADPTNYQLIMESVKFFCWVIGSICGLAVTLLGIYLRMYVTERLHEHTDTIAGIVAANYVRLDVHNEQIRGLVARIEGLA